MEDGVILKVKWLPFLCSRKAAQDEKIPICGTLSNHHQPGHVHDGGGNRTRGGLKLWESIYQYLELLMCICERLFVFGESWKLLVIKQEVKSVSVRSA